jgi:hypothetical protein
VVASWCALLTARSLRLSRMQDAQGVQPPWCVLAHNLHAAAIGVRVGWWVGGVSLDGVACIERCCRAHCTRSLGLSQDGCVALYRTIERLDLSCSNDACGGRVCLLACLFFEGWMA